MIDKKLIPPGVLKFDPETAAHLLDIDPPRSLLDIKKEVEAAGGDPGELIKGRFICKGSVGLFAAETSMGKSSLIVQAAVTWAMGRAAFGMEPTRPLRTLIVQAENDDYDVAEEVAGVAWGLVNKTGCNRDEVEKAMRQVRIISDRASFGTSFVEKLATVLEAGPSFDLVFVDPLFAFAGCDLADQGAITLFLRGQISPMVERFGVALILVHHKVKSSKNAATNRNYNQSYDYHGSAELANFPRFSLVLDRYQDDEGEYYFTLRAPKRGSRLGWPDKEKYLRWSKDCIFWDELTERPATTAGYSVDPATRRQQREIAGKLRLAEEVKAAVALLEPGQATSATDFRASIRGSGISLNKDRLEAIIDAAVCRGLLTKRAPDPTRGEGGRGVRVMIERPRAAPEQGAMELSPKVGESCWGKLGKESY